MPVMERILEQMPRLAPDLPETQKVYSSLEYFEQPRQPQWIMGQASMEQRPTFDRAQLEDTCIAIFNLTTLTPNWAGGEEVPPSSQSVANAVQWLSFLYHDVISLGSRWLRPHVAASPDGEIVMEWWLGKKDLTVFITLDRVTFLVSWGTDIENEMVDGDIGSAQSRRMIWQWFVS